MLNKRTIRKIKYKIDMYIFYPISQLCKYLLELLINNKKDI